MDELNVIETPENVELRQPLSGIGTRFVAGFVDHMVIVGLYLVLIIAAMITWSLGFSDVTRVLRRLGTWSAALLILVLFTIYWGYYVFFEMITNGQSPGKKSVKVRVVKQGGGAVTFPEIAIRNLLRTVDGFVLYGIGGVCMFVTKKGQRLGDLAAGTVVVSEGAPDYSARTDKRRTVQWEQGISADALRATGLTPQEYRLLYNYWVRRGELSFEARQRVLPQLLRPVLERTGRTLDTASIPTLEGYVEQILFHAADAQHTNVPPPLPGGPA